MKRIKGLSALLAVAAALLATPRMDGVEEFYLSRLREGQQSLAEKRFLDAATEFRIACFGLLEDPPLLSGCLAGLALAQDQAGRPPEEVEATLRRFVDVERRFSAFGKAPLSPALQTAFSDLLRKRLPADTLALLPPGSALFESEDQKLAKMPPAERIKALELRAAKEPANAKWPQTLAGEEMARGDAKAAIRWATKALEIAPENPDVLMLRGKAYFQRKEYAKAKTDLVAVPAEVRHPEATADLVLAAAAVRDWPVVSEAAKSLPAELAERPDVKAAVGKVPVPKATPAAAAAPAAPPEAAPTPVPTRSADVPAPPAATPIPPAGTPVPVAVPPVPAKKSALEEGRELLRAGKTGEAKNLFREAVQAAPADRDARKALLEASVLSRDWKLGVEQLPALEPLSDAEAPFLFYASVCLFENGDVAKSRDYLRRARPRIAASPFVEYYSKRILANP